jgi:chemotaxis protein MotB
MAAKDKKNGATIVIKKEEVVEGGHHGGAWKVAYADFVTAMMAFFLLMWLLNATTEAQRKGLADYFSPQNVMSRNSSGSGQPFGGHTPFDEGSEVSDKGAAQVIEGRSPPPPDEETEGDQVSPTQSEKSKKTGQTLADNSAGKLKTAHGNATAETSQEGDKAPGGGVAKAESKTPSKAEFLAYAGAGTQPKAEAATTAEAAAAAAAAAKGAAELHEHEQFEQAAEQIRQAVANDPAAADLGRQLSIDVTPDGLRIQLLDEDQEPMFQSGSSTPSERARLLLEKVAPVLAKLPEQLILTGHTDSSPFAVGGRSNWELSADRANATRRVLVEAGLPDDHFKEVSGRADRDPLLPADPLAAANRRIAIVVQPNYRVQ